MPLIIRTRKAEGLIYCSKRRTDVINERKLFMESGFFDFRIADERIEQLERLFNKLKNNDRAVYIYGAGEYADLLKCYLESKDIHVKGFVVKDHFANKIPNVTSLSKIIVEDNISLIYGLGGGFSKTFYRNVEHIKNELVKCKNYDFFVICDYWLAEQKGLFSHEFIDYVFLKQNIDAFRRTYEMLADELSKNILTEYLYASVCHDALKLAEFGSNWDYDYDLNLLFKKCRDGIVIECGAFDGKTVTEISEFTKNQYNILALECDNENFTKCSERTKNYSNINVIKIGAWDKKAKLAIIQNDSASYLKEVDEITNLANVVEVIDIDSLVGDKKTAALIMDIEGSELKALTGAQQAIKNGANLAVRVYHRKEDLITIPQYIYNLNEKYKFYLRFERGASLCRAGDETTLYAICD